MSNKKPMAGVDYVTLDYEGFRTLMLEKLGEKLPEYTDRSKTDAGIVILELNAIGLDLLSYYIDNIAGEVFFTTAQQRGSVLEWCRVFGYSPKSATPARFEQVFRLVRPLPAPYTIPKGTVVTTSSLTSEDVVFFETEDDLIIPAGAYGDEQDAVGKYLYTVNIVQGSTITDELLGTSMGTADQSFSLQYSPALAESLVVKVNEGYGFTEWTRVESFVDSNSTDRHYIVSVDELDRMKVVFGNGVFGKIPAPVVSGIYCTYRTGGGIEGNVGINKIVEMDTNLAEIKSTFNPYLPFYMGTDSESLESIKVNAVSQLRRSLGALTLEDFASVTRANFPSAILQAHAYITEGDQDSIDLYILLDATVESSFHIISEEIIALFDENQGGRKIVGAGVVTVYEAIPQPLNFSYDLMVDRGYTYGEVEDEVDQYIRDYFALGNRGFEESLFLSDLTTEIKSYVPGVRALNLYIDNVAPVTSIEYRPTRGCLFTCGTINAPGGAA